MNLTDEAWLTARDREYSLYRKKREYFDLWWTRARVVTYILSMPDTEKVPNKVLFWVRRSSFNNKGMFGLEKRALNCSDQAWKATCVHELMVLTIAFFSSAKANLGTQVMALQFHSSSVLPSGSLEQQATHDNLIIYYYSPSSKL